MVCTAQLPSSKWPELSSLAPSMIWNPMQWKFDTLRVASWFNTPVCGVRENFYRLYTLQETTHTTCQKIQRVAFLTLGIVAYALLTPFTAPVGAALRGLVAACEEKPYVYLDSGAPGKTLPENKQVTLVSYNVCFMPGGYSITDGQVTPPSNRARIDANIQKLKELNPDIICLFEVEDACDAAYVDSQFPEYPFRILVAGTRAIGPSSMIAVHSKYKINPGSIKFVPFVKDTELTGRAKGSEKGVLSLDIHSGQDEKPCANITTTHLQHSETPSQPEPSEQQSRRIQTSKILREIQKKVTQACRVIFTGDLNQGEKELYDTLGEHPELNLQRDAQVRGVPTWGGDTWCSKLMKKPASKPEVLDYTFVAGPDTTISTQVIGTGYEGEAFKVNALSDHYILFNRITLGRSA